ncbi:hypothetical protein ElyMa_001511000 [Elysia marginata]|uniref:Uncharacterized protein n=1 Tax=Elysia marginata TaxID=1093978 RepID=A0AAV4J7U5_9GAST|nr:hypothetical protein ElyMa_001511000 [Elysia marginata]
MSFDYDNRDLKNTLTQPEGEPQSLLPKLSRLKTSVRVQIIHDDDDGSIRIQSCKPGLGAGPVRTAAAAAAVSRIIFNLEVMKISTLSIKKRCMGGRGKQREIDGTAGAGAREMGRVSRTTKRSGLCQMVIRGF